AEWKRIPAGRKIELNVDSRGGDIDAGLAIYDTVSRRRDDVTARVSSLAASIASVIVCGAGRVLMPKHAMVLIHNPWCDFAGDAEEHREIAARLDKWAAQIIGIYQAKTGKSEDEIRAAMKASKMMTAAEAKAFGFCDEIISDGQAKALAENLHVSSLFGR